MHELAGSARALARLRNEKRASFKLVHQRQLETTGDTETDLAGLFEGFRQANGLGFTLRAGTVERFPEGELTVTIEHSDDEGQSWEPLVEFDPITAPTRTVRVSETVQAWHDTVRVSWTISGDAVWDVDVACHASAGFSAANLFTLPDPLPEIPAVPTEQDIADALVELGLVTQAEGGG